MFGLTTWWRWWLALGSLAVVGYFVLPLESHGLLHNMYYNAIAVTSSALIAVGAWRHRPTRSAQWYLFAAGQATWAAGDLTYGVLTKVLHREVFPSIADALYLVGYPFLAAGLFLLIRGRISGRDRGGLLDAGIISTGIAVLTWAFIMRPTVVDESLTTLQRLVSLAYPVEDILLIAMAARLFTTLGSRTVSYRLLAGALTLLLGSDIVYAALTTLASYDGGAVDAGWMCSYLAWAAAALHPSMRSLSETAPDQAPRLTRRRLALLTATSLLVPITLIYQGITAPTRIDWLGASLGATVLFLLVLARMSGLINHVQDQASQLDALAHNDALTGVPNRRAWDLELARSMANARRGSVTICVALLDIDHFKQFNDRYGHQAGDRLLKEASAAWKDQLRGTDLLARYGGEEFGLCIPGATADAAADLVRRLQDVTPLGQTFSAGVAMWTGDEAPERLLARADEALYQAKNSGRNRVVIHRPGASAAVDLATQPGS